MAEEKNVGQEQGTAKAQEQKPAEQPSDFNQGIPAQNAPFQAQVSGQSPSQGQPQGGAVPPAPPAQEGVLSAAWRDITASQGWFSRMFLLMIMGCVPVVSLFVNGYVLDWSCELLRGTRTALPKGTFNRKAFGVGFLYWVVSLLTSIASLVLWIFGLIPLVGIIIVFLLNLLFAGYTCIAGLRIALFNRFGAAFDFSDICKVMKRNVGGIFAVMFIPAFIAFIIIFIVVLLFLGGSLANIANTANLYSSYSYLSSSYAAQAILSQLGTLLATIGIMLPLVVFIVGIVGTFAQVWSLRAMAHWVNRFAPEWKEQAENAAHNQEKPSSPTWL